METDTRFQYPEIRIAEAARIQAETRKLDAEAQREIIKLEEERGQAQLRLEEKRLDVEKRRGEVAKLKFETEQARTTQILLDHQAVVARVEREAVERHEAEELSRDLYHHRFYFGDVVKESSVNNCIARLTAWTRQKSNCEIELVLNSPGGSIVDGFALIDFLISLQEQGHKITTLALGMAASMAGVILQAGDERVMGKHALLHMHEGSLYIPEGATYGETQDRLKLMDLFHERIFELFVTRSDGKITREQIKDNWKRRDWWIPAEEALKIGMVDRVQ